MLSFASDYMITLECQRFFYPMPDPFRPVFRVSSRALKSYGGISASSLPRLWLVITLATVCAFSGCKRASPPSSSDSPDGGGEPVARVEPADPDAVPSRVASPPSDSGGAQKLPAKSPVVAPAEIWKEFSGDKAFAEARSQVEI